jgi:hypothetical protein
MLRVNKSSKCLVYSIQKKTFRLLIDIQLTKGILHLTLKEEEKISATNIGPEKMLALIETDL